LSDQRGVNEGFCLILLAVENTCHSPLAVIARPFSTNFIGACIRLSPQTLTDKVAAGSPLAVAQRISLLLRFSTVIIASRSRELFRFSAEWQFGAVGGQTCVCTVMSD
jgi:hypothetical protein